MKKLNINVPGDIEYLSQWKEFDSQLSPGQVIVDKGGCGCGGSEFYLNSDRPVLLVSPRKELINCKMKTNYKRQRKLFYFDRSNKKEKPEDTLNRLKNYLCNPFQEYGFVPKILVTYDSLETVVSFLTNQGLLSDFTIVVDEFTCIFTDVKLKGTMEMNLLNKLLQLENHVVYLSATPIPEKYLDRLPFASLPYVILKWDASRYDRVHVKKIKMRSTSSAIAHIIEEYKKIGYFSIIEQTGERATEAVFFLNSVRDIVKVISGCGLTPSDTLVVCADEDSNKTILKKVGFTVGHVPAEGENNPTFMFVTKASFEGTDFYSNCSMAYVFCDPNKKNLCLDISIDILQVVARCRTKTNPFRNYLNFYYKTSEEQTIADEKERIVSRQDETKRLIEDFSGITRLESLQKLVDAQAMKRYTNDYLDVEIQNDGTGKVVCNELARLSDLRAIDIMEEQFKSGYSIISTFQRKDCDVQSEYAHAHNNQYISEFFTEYYLDENFARRMKLFVDTITAHPEIQCDISRMPNIDINIVRYYETIDVERIRAVRYKPGVLKDLYLWIKAKAAVTNYLSNKLIAGQFYSNPTIKDLLKAAYDKNGVKLAAKATDITNYIESAQQTKASINGKRQQGWKI